MANETHLFLPYNLFDLSPYLRTYMVSFEIEYPCFALFSCIISGYFKIGLQKETENTFRGFSGLPEFYRHTWCLT